MQQKFWYTRDKKCVFFNAFWLLTLELPDRNDINLVRRVQKLYSYQMNLISVFCISFLCYKIVPEIVNRPPVSHI